MRVRVGMREVRKKDEAGDHFSSVDTVSTQLFERVSGDQNLTVAQQAVHNLHQPPPDVNAGPFTSVDNVSSQIFDRMDAIERPGNHPDEQNTSVPPGYVLLRADQVEGVASETAARYSGTEADIAAAGDRPVPNPNVADVGYRAAQRRSQLPDGAEPLEGAPVEVDEDNMLASIREMMVEQKRDFSKKALPELEPVSLAQETGAKSARDDRDHEEVEEFEDIPPNRFQAAVVRFVRTDTVLAICLSIWVSLLMMIFIDPELSQALAIVSLALLVIYRLMQPARRKRRVIKVTRRRSSQYNLALEDAILCQKS